MSHDRALIVKATPISSNGSSPVVLALLSMTAAFALASAFFGRVTELGFLGMSMTLAPVLAEAVREIGERAPEGQANRVSEEFFSELRRRFAKKGDLSVDDVERAMDEALKTAVDDASRNIQTSGSRDAPRVSIESPEGRLINVTTTTQWLPDSVFGTERVRRLNRADAQLGRRIYANSSAGAGQTVAALSYDLQGPNGPLVVAPLLVDLAAGDVGFIGAVALIDHVRALTELLARPRFVISAEGASDEQVLRALGLRPLSAAETGDLPAGSYWTDR